MSVKGDCVRIVGMAACVMLLMGIIMSGEGSAQSALDYALFLAAPDRREAARQADKRRDPKPFLEFAGLRPGMKVLDMGAGGGDSTELIARTVTPAGKVYAQNPADLPDNPRAAFDSRLNTPGMGNVVPAIRPFADPLPPDIPDFDLITFLFFYRDTTYMKVD